ncbi:hypothetical protein [Geomicrobium sp. JCM 19039]|uniref:hypothetical protein n=1 Tax=Geomicrobium sp. JCM 19039 TaxID=1460636 RepID=UPI00045F4661|nr:hypothetical protein [Geomicrobium sp. JCM 19039]GAK13946.1 hypothetical protein JCM19039_3831 [Geomicrobium sp. JCM 19039]
MIRKVIGSLIILLGVVGGLGIIAAGDVTFAEIGFVLLIIGIGVVTGFVRKTFFTPLRWGSLPFLVGGFALIIGTSDPEDRLVFMLVAGAMIVTGVAFLVVNPKRWRTQSEKQQAATKAIGALAPVLPFIVGVVVVPEFAGEAVTYVWLGLLSVLAVWGIYGAVTDKVMLVRWRTTFIVANMHFVCALLLLMAIANFSEQPGVITGIIAIYMISLVLIHWGRRSLFEHFYLRVRSKFWLVYLAAFSPGVVLVLGGSYRTDRLATDTLQLLGFSEAMAFSIYHMTFAYVAVLLLMLAHSRIARLKELDERIGKGQDARVWTIAETLTLKQRGRSQK